MNVRPESINKTGGKRTSGVTYDTSEDEQKRCSAGRW